jgi:hypothetical protein
LWLWLGTALMLSAAPAQNSTGIPRRWRLSPVQVLCAAPILILGVTWFLFTISPPFHQWVRDIWPRNLYWLRSFAVWEWGIMLSLLVGLTAMVHKASKSEDFVRPEVRIEN